MPLLVLLGGCPPPPRYLVADVTVGREPAEDAMVAADCGIANSTVRTNEDGRARLQLFGKNLDAERCVVTVAKRGYPTIVATGVSLCTAPYACPPIWIQLDRGGPIEWPAPAPFGEPRTYATPPPGDLR
ncbi:MAG TPA: hypothetical protein VFQ53_01590 [Kofleriaceae bacterium]|nr:hypothetical protein [Kofleriaceae bacterium]